MQALLRLVQGTPSWISASCHTQTHLCLNRLGFRVRLVSQGLLIKATLPLLLAADSYTDQNSRPAHQGQVAAPRMGMTARLSSSAERKRPNRCAGRSFACATTSTRRSSGRCGTWRLSSSSNSHWCAAHAGLPGCPTLTAAVLSCISEHAGLQTVRLTHTSDRWAQMDRLVARMREICLKQKLFADRQVGSRLAWGLA